MTIVPHSSRTTHAIKFRGFIPILFENLKSKIQKWIVYLHLIKNIAIWHWCVIISIRFCKIGPMNYQGNFMCYIIISVSWLCLLVGRKGITFDKKLILNLIKIPRLKDEDCYMTIR